MKPACLGAIALGLWPALAIASGDVVPRPHGWVGTTDQWRQGLGIAFALLNLIVLAVAWRRISRTGMVRGALGTLLIGLAVLPLIVVFFGYTQGMDGMESVRACGGCHVMAGHVQDLQNKSSESLAAVHFKNRYILENQCYTCHSDYGMLGTLSAKMDGVRHIVHLVAGTYELPIKIARPYSNVRCLVCHGESQKFVTSPGHPDDVRPQLLSGEVSCLTCHAPAHTPEAAPKRAAR